MKGLAMFLSSIYLGNNFPVIFRLEQSTLFKNRNYPFHLFSRLARLVE